MSLSKIIKTAEKVSGKGHKTSVLWPFFIKTPEKRDKINRKN